MAALTQNRAPTERAGTEFEDPLAAGVRIFRSAMVALDGSGNAVNATAAGGVVRGVAMAEADNTGGVAGAKRVSVKRGVFLFANNGLTRAAIGTSVRVTDNQTVGGAGAAVAGILMDIDAQGAWVRIG